MQVLTSLDQQRRSGMDELLWRVSRWQIFNRSGNQERVAEERQALATAAGMPAAKRLVLVSDADPPPLTPAPTGQVRAVLVGISRYQFLSPSQQLRFAAMDAVQFARFLMSPRGGSVPPQNIQLLVDARATRARIERSVVEAFVNAQQGDRVVLFFSAHGMATTNEGFLVAYDADPQDPRDHAYPMANLAKLVQSVDRRLSRIDVFVDSCRSGYMGLTLERNERPNEPMRAALNGPNDVLGFFASQPKELAFEHENFDSGHGVFTFHLLEALNTNLAAQDGKIDISSLERFISDNVEKSTQKVQHPRTLITLQGADRRDLVLAMTKDVGIPIGRGTPIPLAEIDRIVQADRKRASGVGPKGTVRDVTPPIEPSLGKQLDQLISLEEQGQQLVHRYLQGDEVPQIQTDFQNGAEIYRRALALSPESPELESRQKFFEARALLFEKDEKQWDQAISLLEEAIRLEPAGALAYNALGIAYLQKAQYTRALGALHDAIQRARSWPYPRHNRALAMVETGQYDEAIREYRLAMQLSPDRAYLHYNLGTVYQRLNRRREAEEQFLIASKRPNYSVPSLIALGVLRRRPADLRAALNELKTKPDPQSAILARHNLAGILAMKKGDESEAVSLWKINADEKYVPSMIALAERSTTPTAAVAAYLDALEVEPNNAGLRLKVADLLEASDPAASLTQVRKALEIHPENPTLLLRLGRLEERAGDSRAARAAYQAAERLAADPVLRKQARRAVERLP
jgi:Tfp pilus assembly protein PilF